MRTQKNDAAVLSAVSQKVLAQGNTPEPVGKRYFDHPWTLPGFFGKSRVVTSFGKLPIEALRRRDPVKTITGAYLEVQWVDKVQLDEDFLEHHPEAHPIFIPQNALGAAQPELNLLVSPAQKLKEPGRVGDNTLKPASSLVNRTKATRLPHAGFTYYVFHCGQPAVVNVDGLWFETKA